MVVPDSGIHVGKTPSHWWASFVAMASSCQLLVDADDAETVKRLILEVEAETGRIEAKFSRYRDDNIIHKINTAKGRSIEVDKETGLLLDFGDTCYQLSEGLFDITSGVLRKVWAFNGKGLLPTDPDIAAVRRLVGWEKVSWKTPEICMPAGMELDLGGIGKEYAVDRCYGLLCGLTDLPFLLNFGGDLRVSGLRREGQPWRIGVEDPSMQKLASKELELFDGAMATSGDSQRFLMVGGKRYSHILNPKTGWPVEGAPRSVTVAAPTALEAGMLATLASLEGKNAEGFLNSQQVQHWVLR